MQKRFILVPNEIKFLFMLKRMQIHYELVHEEDINEYSCWTVEGIKLNGQGSSINEAKKDLIAGLRDYAKFYLEDFEDWFAGNPDEYIYVLKIINSTDEELISCLTQTN